MKAVLAAGLELVVVENTLEGDQVRTDVQAVHDAVAAVGADAVVCVLSTTSCFAPRGADRVVELARLCAELGCGHVVNNAYGVQSSALCAAICTACRRGRVDAFVQSTDKNFMVPVGGAIVAAPKRDASLVRSARDGRVRCGRACFAGWSMVGVFSCSQVSAVNKAYPGRACAAPLVDLLMTLLHLGADGWRAALRAREDVFPYLRERLAAVAEEHGAHARSAWALHILHLALKPRDWNAGRAALAGERVMDTPDNPISVGMTLSSLVVERDGAPSDAAVTFFGSMLFSRCVSGTRTVARGKRQDVGGVAFEGYGAHHSRRAGTLARFAQSPRSTDSTRAQLPGAVPHGRGSAWHDARRRGRLLRAVAQVLRRCAQKSRGTCYLLNRHVMCNAHNATRVEMDLSLDDQYYPARTTSALPLPLPLHLLCSVEVWPTRRGVASCGRMLHAAA